MDILESSGTDYHVYGILVLGIALCVAVYVIYQLKDELKRYDTSYDLRIQASQPGSPIPGSPIPGSQIPGSPIPKMIHQIWIGKEIPDTLATLVSKMKSVHEGLGYQHRLWGNELWTIYKDDPYIQSYTNTTIPLAYITDRFRLLLLRDYGGIAVDPDCEVVRPFDAIFAKLSPNITYFAGLREEINPGALIECTIQGSTKNSRVVQELLKVYTKLGYAPGGKITSDKMIKIVDTDVALMNWEHFFDTKKGPRTIVFHEKHTLDSWRDPKEKAIFQLKRKAF